MKIAERELQRAKVENQAFCFAFGQRLKMASFVLRQDQHEQTLIVISGAEPVTLRLVEG